MTDTLRLLRGNAKIITLPKLVADQIEIGDLLWWDAVNGRVRNAETVPIPDEGDYSDQKTAFAGAFVGVALSKHEAGMPGDVLVATGGDFMFDCPDEMAYEVGDTVAVGTGTVMQDQTVFKSSTDAIGRVLQPKPAAETRVEIRIRPTVSK